MATGWCRGGHRRGTTVLAAETTTLALLLLTTPVGFALATMVMVGFSAGVWLVMRRGVRAACRCFGGAGGPLSRIHLGRNLTLLGVSLTGLVASLSTPALDLRSPVLLPVVVAAAVVAVLLIRVEDVAALARPAAPRGVRRG